VPPHTDAAELLAALEAEQAEEVERSSRLRLRRRAGHGVDLKMMQSMKARVRNGRLVLDEPTDRPEGEEVELVPLDEVLGRGGDYLDDEERAALHRSIEEGVEDFEKGDTEDAFEFLTRLKARRENRDRQASASSGRTSK
jgi:hypothetical protein